MALRELSLGRAARVSGALAAVGAVTLLFARLIPVNPTTVGFVYLITILVIATVWGLTESVVASLAATLCFNFFFLPPVGTFTIADPQNWVELFAFLATSLIASHLSERAKRRTIEAVSRRQDVDRLYALSRAMLSTDRNQPFAAQIAEQIARIFEFSSVVIFDRSRGHTHHAGPAEPPEISGKLQEAATKGTLFRDLDTQTIVTPISLGGQPIGGLALEGASLTDTGLQALSNLVAIGIERTRAQEVAAHAAAAQHSEEFKSTLLDALAHEFKTPLTSIKTAATAILSSGVTKPEQQHELLTIIDQEASRLAGLVTEAIHVASIEAGKIHLNREPYSVRELIQTALHQKGTVLDGRAVKVSVADNLREAFVDVELAQLVMRQLIDNAVKYSPPASPIRIAAGVAGETVVIRVRNEGPGISEAEKTKIFEKFYRAADARQQVTGTGMGLAVARQIALAHGGDLLAESVPGQGAEFAVSFPAAGKVIRTWPTTAY